MISVKEAKDIVITNVKTITDEEVDLTNSLGRILRQDIVSDLDIPPFSNSAMDGYAVRDSDIEKTPVTLKVIEDVAAGSIATKELSAGEAVRIMTGAPVPKGTDTVVMQEDTEMVHSRQIKILKNIKPGKNIRLAGEDMKRGELVVKKGTKLKSAHLGLLASLGMPKVKVARKPRIAIFSTGDEVVDITEELKPGKIHNSNGYSLYGQIVMSVAEPVLLGIARDRKEEILEKIQEGIKNDMLIISGGVSVGDYDMVHKILMELGIDMKFQKVAMRPGKPTVFGLLRGKPVFGLPGNPVSTMITFELYVKPVIYKMIGYNFNFIKDIEAELEEDIKKKKDLRYFLRAVTKWKEGRYVTKTTGPQGSGILKSMTIANSLIELPEDVEKAEKGSRVKVKFLGH